MAIHWCGTGLSAIPGLRRLIAAGPRVTVRNRTLDKARAAVGDLTGDIRAFDFDALAAAVENGDVIVSMLPADQHPELVAHLGRAGGRSPAASPPARRAAADAARAPVYIRSFSMSSAE